MGGDIKDVLIEFDPRGSLATTHESQGSDLGLFAGFMGWEPSDKRVTSASQAVREAGINVKFRIREYDAQHPNTYKLHLRSDEQTHEIVAVSTGGGMIEITQLDGFQLSLAGDFYETLILIDDKGHELLGFLNDLIEADQVLFQEKDRVCLIDVKSQSFISREIITQLSMQFPGALIREIAPLLPVLSRSDIELPFTTYAELLGYNQDKNLDLWQLALHYESARGNLTKEKVIEVMR